jgi:hypothetical protein
LLRPSWFRRVAAPQILAACRNTELCFLHRIPSAGYAEAIRRLAARPDETISLLILQRYV